VGGNLEAVEKETGVAWGKPRRAERVEDLAERGLDVAAIGKVGELEWLRADWVGPLGQGMVTDVEVAVRFAMKRGRVAFGAGGHDVTAFGTHWGTPPKEQDSLWKSFGFSWMRQVRRGNSMILFWLRADYWKQRGYSCSLPALFEVMGREQHHEMILRQGRELIGKLAGGFFVSSGSRGCRGFEPIDECLHV
jgi:hypothetical protein